jgi:hypothetical protein
MDFDRIRLDECHTQPGSQATSRGMQHLASHNSSLRGHNGSFLDPESIERLLH